MFSYVYFPATVFNRPNLQGLKGNLVLGDNQEYSIDISNTRKLDKKKVSFKPLISLRNPAAEVFAFGGSMQYVYGKKLDYSFVLDKFVSKKITLKGKELHIHVNYLYPADQKGYFANSVDEMGLNECIKMDFGMVSTGLADQ